MVVLECFVVILYGQEELLLLSLTELMSEEVKYIIDWLFKKTLETAKVSSKESQKIKNRQEKSSIRKKMSAIKSGVKRV